MFFEHIVIIPCFNEEKRLDRHNFSKHILNNKNILFVFVNDGSSDKTVSVVNAIISNKENSKLVDFKSNSGKSEALRKSILHCFEKYDFKTIGYLDADLAVSIDDYLFVISHNKGNKISFGSRIKLVNNTIERSPVRHIIGRFISTIVDTIFDLGIYDTQCGCKSFDKSIIPMIFKEKFISRWLFDIEIFLRLRSHSFKLSENCVEIPLKSWNEIDGSKIPFSYSFGIWYDIYKIYRHYNGKKLLR